MLMAFFAQAPPVESWDWLWKQFPMIGILVLIMWRLDQRAGDREAQHNKLAQEWMAAENERNESLRALGESCHSFQIGLQKQSDERAGSVTLALERVAGTLRRVEEHLERTPGKPKP